MVFLTCFPSSTVLFFISPSILGRPVQIFAEKGDQCHSISTTTKTEVFSYWDMPLSTKIEFWGEISISTLDFNKLLELFTRCINLFVSSTYTTFSNIFQDTPMMDTILIIFITNYDASFVSAERYLEM